MAGRSERDLRPVGRPRWRRFLEVALEELRGRRRPVGGDQPDGARVVAGFPVDPPDRIGDGAAVRGDPRLAGPGQLVDVFGLHAGHGSSPSFVRIAPERAPDATGWRLGSPMMA